MIESGRTSQAPVATADRFPHHIAIIMDGNGRWAKARGLPRAAGHRQGVEALRTAVESCQALGVTHLTVYSFSTENWSRPPAEIDALFDLLRIFIRRDLARLHKAGVRIRVVGERAGLTPDILALLEEAVATTRSNSDFNLTIAFNYGGRAEIVSAAKALAERVARGELSPDDISEDTLGAAMWTADLPPPDLVIRTSGELRLSNFLLWSGAYSELMFLELWWPDFDRSALEQAIDAYRKRDRRFGGVVT